MNRRVHKIIENVVKRVIKENIHDEIDAAWDEFNRGGGEYDEFGGFDSEYMNECARRNLKQSLRRFKLI